MIQPISPYQWYNNLTKADSYFISNYLSKYYSTLYGVHLTMANVMYIGYSMYHKSIH